MNLRPRRACGKHLQTDLFGWAPSPRAPLPLAVERIARRFCLSPELARVICEAAGINVEARP